MKYKLTASLTFAAALATLSAAHAADIARPAPVQPVPQVAPVPFSWSGLYLGINGGYGFGRDGLSGGLVGGQIGYNWQTGPLVLGLESDLDWAHISGSRSDAACAPPGGGNCRTRQDWLGTTRGRLGYAFGSWLPYVTGGAAYGDIKLDQPGRSDTATRLGWTAGAGVEYSLSKNWSAKVEWLHLDLGTASFMGAASSTPVSTPAKDDIVRAGINYHW